MSSTSRLTPQRYAMARVVLGTVDMKPLVFALILAVATLGLGACAPGGGPGGSGGASAPTAAPTY